MSTQDKKEEIEEAQRSGQDMGDLVAETDTGGRNPTGIAKKVILGAALLWSLFQIWIASPLPFALGFGVFNDTEARSIHLAFAILLAYLAFPAFARSPRSRIPIQDWLFAVIGAFCAGYVFLFYRDIAGRPGNPNTMDIVVACAGMVLLLEATRRSLGPALAVLAVIFLGYTFAGPHMPGFLEQ